MLITDKLPLTLVNKQVRITPTTLEVAAVTAVRLKAVSIWSNPDTLKVASEYIGENLTLRNFAMPTLNENNIPTLNETAHPLILVLVPIYNDMFFLANGVEVQANQIQSWKCLMVDFR
jgi:hypothetical protein